MEPQKAHRTLFATLLPPRGKTENSEYEKRRRLHLQSPPLRFEALIFGLPLKARHSKKHNVDCYIIPRLRADEGDGQRIHHEVAAD